MYEHNTNDRMLCSKFLKFLLHRVETPDLVQVKHWKHRRLGSTVSIRKQVKLCRGEPHNYAQVGSWYQGTSVTFLLHCNVNTACDFQKLKINL